MPLACARDAPAWLRQAIQPLLVDHGPQLADAESEGAGIGAHPYALDWRARYAELDGSGRFEPAHHVVVPWSMTLTREETTRFLRSFSSWMALETATRERLLASIGELVDDTFHGVVERPFLTAIYFAQRR